VTAAYETRRSFSLLFTILWESYEGKSHLGLLQFILLYSYLITLVFPANNPRVFLARTLLLFLMTTSLFTHIVWRPKNSAGKSMHAQQEKKIAII